MKYTLTIQIVGWNSEETLPDVVEGLRAVPPEVTVRYIDNGSTDGSVALVKSEMPRAEIVTLSENVGFTNGHNIGLAKCTTEYVLTHDPDLRLEWSGIARLLERMEQEEQVGAIQGKLLRAEDHTLIDSAGIVLTLSRNGRERGGGEAEAGQFKEPVTIDAVTGACGLFRTEALRQVSYGDYTIAGRPAIEVFDKDFFAYKDDVDLGWRLRKAGWRISFEPVLAGYHRRTVGVRGALGWGLSPKNIAQRLRQARTRYSFRNYIWMLMKNMTIWDEIRFDLFIVGRVLVFLVLSGIYWPLFAVWGEIGRGIPTMLRKRRDFIGKWTGSSGQARG